MSLLLFKTIARLLQWLPEGRRIFPDELLPSDLQSPPAGELCCPDSMHPSASASLPGARSEVVLCWWGSEGGQHPHVPPCLGSSKSMSCSFPSAQTDVSPGEASSSRAQCGHRVTKHHGAAPRLISLSTGRANEDTKLHCLGVCPALTWRCAVPPLGAPSRTQCTDPLLCHFLGTRAH